MRKLYPTRVVDNGLPNNILNDIIQKYQYSFSYGWKAKTGDSEDQGHWNVPICNQNPKSLEDLSSTLYEKCDIVYILWAYLKNCFIGERFLSRVYINGYTYGTDGYIHRDDRFYDELGNESHYSESIIIYLNKEWKMDWGGETIIIGEDGEIEKSIIPKFGRMLIFDSQLEHAARPLSRMCKDLRMVLVFKTMIKQR